jgi:diadenosine tetraphosphate (Ap4A) HIT family hydrolase
MVICPKRRKHVRDCDFCNEFGGGVKNAFAERYSKELSDRVLIATDDFRTVPSLGQIVEGHLLIVPVHHYRAVADMSAEHVGKLEILCDHVRSVLQDQYGHCIFFEHGIRKDGGGCGIDHAHVHALPLEVPSVLSFLTRTFKLSRVHHLADIGSTVTQGSSYLFFEDATSQRYVVPVNHLPSQYMRKLVAESIGRANWNWRDSGRESELISTLHRLSNIPAPTISAHRG